MARGKWVCGRSLVITQEINTDRNNWLVYLVHNFVEFGRGFEGAPQAASMGPHIIGLCLTPPVPVGGVKPG
jgi:hypothetical protein